MTLAYFTSATLHKLSLYEEFCTLLFALSIRLLCEMVHHFRSYRTEFYYAVFAVFERVKKAATAAGRPVRDALMTQVSVFGFGEMLIIQDSVATAIRTSPRLEKDNSKAAQARL